MNDLGTVKPGTTLFFPFSTFDSNDPSESSAVTGLVVGDILVYKDGGTTERASTAGYTVAISFDTKVGLNGVTIDLSDDTTADFFKAGSDYTVAVGDITVDAATIRFWVGRFRIGYPGAILDTWVTVSTQTSVTLNVGPAEADALNGAVAIIHDEASDVQFAVVTISDYAVTTKVATLAAAPGFTIATGDNISVFLPTPVVGSLTGHTAQTADHTSAISTIDTEVGAIQTDLDNATDGLGALKTLIDAVQTDLDNGTDGLGALKILIDAVNTDLSNGTDGLGALKALIDTVNTDLSNGTDGLGALKILIDAIQTTADAVETDTQDLQTQVGTAGAGLTNITLANDISATMKTSVQTAVDAAIDTAISELTTGVPSATPTLRTGLMLLYMALRNRLDVNTSAADEIVIYDDSGTKIAGKLLTDSGGDYSEAEMA